MDPVVKAILDGDLIPAGGVVALAVFGEWWNGYDSRAERRWRRRKRRPDAYAVVRPFVVVTTAPTAAWLLEQAWVKEEKDREEGLVVADD